MLLSFKHPNFFLLFICHLFAIPFLSAQEEQPTVEICINKTIIDDETLIAEVYVFAPEPLIGMQLGLEWSLDSLEFKRVAWVNEEAIPEQGGNSLLFGLPHQNNSNGSKLTFSWIGWGGFIPTDLSSGATIFTVEFKRKTESVPKISFILPTSSSPVETYPQFIAEENKVLPYTTNNCGKKSFITGRVNMFEDRACSVSFTPVRYTGWKVIASTDQKNYFGIVSANGSFHIPVDLGDFTVQLIPPSNIWAACNESVVIKVDSIETSYNVDLGAYINNSCPLLKVDLITPFLRRCFNNYYVIQYENFGTESANDAFVQVDFDEWLTIQTTSIPWNDQNGQKYTFPVGDLQPGAKGQFEVYFNVSCDADLGITHCSEAQIFPRTTCKNPSSFWSGASIEVTGECNHDLVQFMIQNNGQSDMAHPLEYVVTEDIVMINRATFQLKQGESTTVEIPASGKTYRLEAQQVTYHPGNSMPSAFVEGCTDGSPISLGLVNQFPLDDDDFFIDLDCQPNIGSFDPNDKQAFPNGTGETNEIPPNIELEYLIRFQNTGTDTAFNIEILDTLSPLLKTSSIQEGTSSHPYSFDILEDGILRFYFPNILLPDSTTNEPESHGFVKFTIEQQPNLAPGATIENQAAIYFDFNEPIITNQVLHTIQAPVFAVATIVSTDIELQNQNVQVYPNPMNGSTLFSIIGATKSNYHLELYNAPGKLVRKKHFNGSQIQLQRDQLNNGLFFYRIYAGQQLFATGKLLVR